MKSLKNDSTSETITQTDGTRRRYRKMTVLQSSGTEEFLKKKMTTF